MPDKPSSPKNEKPAGKNSDDDRDGAKPNESDDAEVDNPTPDPAASAKR